MQNIMKKMKKFLFNGRFLVVICLILCYSCEKKHTAIFETVATESTNLPILDIPNKPQEATAWCWAASIQMVISYLNNQEISQCDIATRRVFLEKPSLDSSLSACHSKRSTNGCTFVDSLPPENEIFFQSLPAVYSDTNFRESCGIDPKSNIDVIKNILKSYNLEGIQLEKKENTLKMIKFYINKKSPIIALYVNSGLATHVVVINGYQEVNGHTYLLINNPLFDKNPSCEGCLHLIQTDDKGDNELSYQEDGEEGDNRPKNGTYCALAYLAITKPLSTKVN